MKELLGKKCLVEFDLPYSEWPTRYPANVQVTAIEMPLIALKDQRGEYWANAKYIKKIVSIDEPGDFLESEEFNQAMSDHYSAIDVDERGRTYENVKRLIREYFVAK